MNDNMTPRAEWDAMTDDEKFQSLQLSEQDNAHMRSVLAEIPECPDHGFCLPYFRDWIRQRQGKPFNLDGDLLMFDRDLRGFLRQEP